MRHLREPSHAGGDQYLADSGRSTGCRHGRSAELVERFNIMLNSKEIVEHWRWIYEDVGSPKMAAQRRHLHGERIPGALMLRPVTVASRPTNGGGRLEELASVLGLPIDLDVAERRPGDTRRYCPTMAEGRAFLERRLEPSVLIDAGGGLLAVWLFTEPAAPRARPPARA